MRRSPQWPEALAQLLASPSPPFRYGSWDCCLAAFEAVRSMTGVDLAAAYRGRYGSRLEAVRMVGGFRGGLVGVLEEIFRSAGLAEIPVARARRGDLVLVPTPEGFALGVVDLRGTHAVVAGPRGRAFLRLARSVRAWEVP